MSRNVGEIEEHVDEAFGLRSKDPAFEKDDAVGAVGEEFSGGNDFESLLAGDADAHDDGNTEAEFNVFFDHFPATHFHRNLVSEAVLLEGAVHQTPGA